MLHRSDIEVQRNTLITDVLWVEQNLVFQLDRNEELLQRIGSEVVSGHATSRDFELRSRALLSNSEGLIQILRIDANGALVEAVPELLPDGLRGNGARTYPSRELLQLAQSVGKRVYGPPYSSPPQDHQFEIHVPLFVAGDFAGAVVGVYSLRSLVSQMVPWWFAEKYRLNIVDTAGQILASKTGVDTGSDGPSYQMALEPPGQGLALQVIAHRSETRLLPALLFTTIVALSAAIVWSLWALRRHVQRRFAAEAALREEHAFRKAMEDSLLTGMRARDLEGRITYVNPAFCRMVGWSAEELIGLTPPMPYWAQEDIEHTRTVHDSVLSGHPPAEGVEVRLQRKDGTRFDALIFEAPLIDTQGRQTGWMGSVLDITERKRAQEFERQQQEKLQATARLVTMGELASTLAHELNQPLAAISSYNTGCLNKLDGGEYSAAELAPVLRKIGQQAQRAGQIIRRVHDFVRRSEPNRESCDVNSIIEDALGLMEPDTRRQGTAIVSALSAHLPPVMADRVMVEQLVLNLMRNGMDAMRGLPQERRRLVISSAPAGNAVEVAIADHGCGIPPEIAVKLFEPFYTTKSEGMGMGLNICRSIIELHKGRLWFEANPAGGTIFRFTLPLDGK